jgi:hypothetical protein
MDIIISAEQGAGKTTLALGIIKAYLGAKSVSDIVHDILKVKFVGDSVPYLTEKLRDAKPQAVLFDDGVITNPAEMLVAVEAVKRYRAQTGRPRTLAIYVEQQPNVCVVLQDHVEHAKYGLSNANQWLTGAPKSRFTEDELLERAINPRYTEAMSPDWWEALNTPPPSKADARLFELWDIVAAKASVEQQRAMLNKLRELWPGIDNPKARMCKLSVDQSAELHAFLLDLKRKQDEQ